MQKSILLSAVSILLLSSCAMVKTNSVSSGMFYTGITEPMMVVKDDGDSDKTGKACQSNILGLILTGDSSLIAAAKEGHISKINSVDNEKLGIFGLYAKSCTIVRGK